MPKGKKKYKTGGRSKQDSVFASEEESVGDTNSIASNLSELRDDSDEETLIDCEEPAIYSNDFEDKLIDALEGTLQKNLKTRLDSLNVIKKSLSSRYLCDFIFERQVTMCDIVERSLKRGKGEEQVLGAVLATLLCTQMGAVEDSEVIFNTLQPILLVLLMDATISANVRAQCASSLGLCCFASCPATEVVQSTMDSLYSIFSGSFQKGNGVQPLLKPEISSLHSSALMGWSLLLTVLSPPYIMSLSNSVHLRKLPQLLDSTDVDLRIAAGETLAVFYELARQCQENFEGYEFESLCDKLRTLATDSQKFRAKKDRRQQRSSFRDILRAIEERETLDIRVRLGEEVLYIDSWCHKRQYDAFCQILGSGMKLHLKQNELLRDIFELGAPLIEEKGLSKNEKLQRYTAHLAAEKARSKCLSKLRDKRADIL